VSLPYVRRVVVAAVTLFLLASCGGGDSLADPATAVGSELNGEKFIDVAAREFADVASVGAEQLAALPTNGEPDEVTHWVMCALRQTVKEETSFVREQAWFGAWADDQPVAVATSLIRRFDALTDELIQTRRHRAQVGPTRWSASPWPVSGVQFRPETIDMERTQPPWIGPLVDLRTLTDVSQLLPEFHLDDTTPTTRTDRSGGTFDRYNRSSFTKGPGEVAFRNGPSAFHLMLEFSTSPFALDVWHENGQVTRLRAQLFEPMRYAEIRFESEPTPPGSNIEDLDCPLTFDSATSSNVWMGPEY